MFRLLDGRIFLYQWDSNIKLAVDDATVSEVHFKTRYDNAVYTVEVIRTDSDTYANIPNILLQQSYDIIAYMFCRTEDGNYTKITETLEVMARPKPADYVYTETELKSYYDLEKRIEELEKGGAGGGISQETDPTVPAWAKEPKKPSYSADEIGAVSKEEFNTLSGNVSKLSEDKADKENTYTKAEVDAKIQNVPSGGGGSSDSSGGHWETVMDIAWDFNDYITVVSYDAENHIFTCSEGELDWATVGERLTYAVFPVCDNNSCKTKEMPFNDFRELSGVSAGKFLGGFVKLTDTTFTFKDTEGNIVPVPNEATMDISKFHFEHLENRTIDNLKCKKARYTLTDMIVSVSGYSTPPEFLKDTQNSGNTEMVHSWTYKSCTQTEVAIIGGFALEKSSTTQLSTGTGTYVSSSIRNYFKQTRKPVEEINSLFFSIDWNNGVNLPRNGGLFKLERWVE